MSRLPASERQTIQPRWFEKPNGGRDNFTRHILPHKDAIHRYLEIGTFAGASLFWVFENIQPTLATAVDPYPADRKRDAATTTAIGDEVERIWQEHFGHIVGELIRRPSEQVLPEMITACRVYDLVYIDGSHHGADVFYDAAVASRLVRPGGFLIFDDFQAARRRNVACLRLAIDAFVRTHVDDFQLLFANRQVGLRRRRERRYTEGSPPGVGRSILHAGEYDNTAASALRYDTGDGILDPPTKDQETP